MKETTTTKTAKPYEGRASVAAIIALAKRSEHVRYRPSDRYGKYEGVIVSVNGTSSLRPEDYGRGNDGYVGVGHKATGVNFRGNVDDATMAVRVAGFKVELEAAGWELVMYGKYGGVVVGPGWREFMADAYDRAIEYKAYKESENARAKREGAEIRTILAGYGISKYVEDYGYARVTLTLEDIEKLTGAKVVS